MYEQGKQYINGLSFIMNIETKDIKGTLEVRYYKREFKQLELTGLSRRDRLNLIRKEQNKEKWSYIEDKASINLDDFTVFTRFLWKYKRFRFHPIDKFDMKRYNDEIKDNNTFDVLIKKYRISEKEFGYITILNFNKGK